MRTTKLFAAVLVAGLIGSACQQNPDYVLPAINVASEEIVFSTDLDYILELTSTREWRVRNKPDWVTVEPDRGGASDVAQRTRISVPVNPEYNRSGHIVFSIGLAKATVAVSQSGAKGDIPVGSGTLEDPYTVTGVIRYVESLGSDVESPQEVYIKGTIDEVTEEYTARYGNGSFKMRNESGEEVFYVYRTKFLENKNWVEGDTQIQRGDEVVVYGTVVNFRGNTPETAQGKSYLYSLNGETQGSGGGGGQTATTIFSQAFKTAGQGAFTIEDKTTLPEGMTYVWTYDNRYGMKATAFVNNACVATESWLISPVIDLSSAANPVLTFRHAINKFATLDNAKTEATVWAKANGGEWTQLSGLTYPDSQSWNFVDSGEISLSAYAGKEVQIAFKYVSTTSSAGTWEVDGFEVVNK